MKDRLIKISLSNGLFYSGILVSLYGLIRTWILRSRLPAGVCPIDDNRGIYMIGIVLLLTSIVVDYYKERSKVDINKNNTDNN